MTGRPLEDLYDWEINNALDAIRGEAVINKSNEEIEETISEVNRAEELMKSLRRELTPFMELRSILESNDPANSGSIDTELNAKITALESFITNQLGAGPENIEDVLNAYQEQNKEHSSVSPEVIQHLQKLFSTINQRGGSS